jgi:RNA polymerase sigma-70 factor (ECF subfamily)
MEAEGQAQAARRIQEALGQLSDTDRALAHLYYFEQRSLAEIAAILGSTRDAIKMRLARTRRRLRDLLRDCDELF